jgi:large subunit ribosomal protein L25
MEKIILKAAAREDIGKGVCGRIRKKGQVPGVIYRGGKEGLNIVVDSRDLWAALHTSAGENAIITLDIGSKEAKDKKTVIVREIQEDPINDSFVHVDFYEISLKDKLRVKVPVTLKGEAEGVKTDGGIMNQVLWELEVECLPTQIPERIEVQVEALHINEAIHIKDVKAPEGVQLMGDGEQVVVVVTPPKAEEVVEAVPVEGAEAVAEPELIKKGKKEEEGEEGEEGAAEAKEPGKEKGAAPEKGEKKG